MTSHGGRRLYKYTSSTARFGLGTLVLVALSSGGASCHPTPAVTFDVDVPSSLTDSVAWYEIGAFPGASCADLLPSLSGGVPTAGAATRVVFNPNDPAGSTPTLGDIPRTSYAFAVTAKDASCKIIATGCTQVDVSKEDSVDVPLAPLGQATGGCTGATSCTDGECVPPGEGTTDIGAGCSLALVGAGPLAEALQPAGGEATSAPAVVVTPSGFLVAYREFDKSTEAARVTTFAIDDSASAGTTVYTSLPQRCMVVESDATGLAWNGTEGLVVVSHELCAAANVSGEDTLRVDANGLLARNGLNTITTPSQQAIKLSTKAVAADPTGEQFYVAHVISNQTSPPHPYAAFALTDGLAATFEGKYTTPALATSDMVATTSAILASVAVGTGVSGDVQKHMGLRPQASDGGTGGPVADGGTGGPVTGDDGGSAFGDDDDASVDVDAGGSNMASLYSGAPSLGFTSLPLTGQWAANWASITAEANRVFVVSGVSGGAELRSVDVGGMASASIPVALSGDGAVIFSDAALAGDHLFLATARPGALALVAYSNATSTPRQIRQIDLDKDPRVGTFTDLADGHVAIAASATRVAVVWTTQKTLLERDPVGGYAIYACSK